MARSPVIVLVTSFFPFGVGEQFIAAELRHWDAASARWIILPEQFGGAGGADRRPIPDGIELDTSLARRWASPWWRALSLLVALVSPRTIRELGYLATNRLLSRYRVAHGIKSSAQVWLISRSLSALSARVGGIDLVYAYWLSVASIGAVTAKRWGRVRRVVARAHRTDLYEYARPQEYNALIRGHAGRYDLVASISADGAAHLSRYGFSDSQVRVHRLGVPIPAGRTQPTPPGRLSLVSVSNVTPVKRVEVIAEAARLVAEAHPDTSVCWTHLGDGPLAASVADLVGRAPRPANLEVVFGGRLPHGEVLDRLDRGEFDVFVNASESEGVPVSIMEAMARGIPAIAPDVGAVREVVLPGMLLPAGPDAAALAEAIGARADAVKDPGVRQACAQSIAVDFDADRNHRRFVADLIEMATR